MFKFGVIKKCAKLFHDFSWQMHKLVYGFETQGTHMLFARNMVKYQRIVSNFRTIYATSLNFKYTRHLEGAWCLVIYLHQMLISETRYCL